jgi:hypothetical protein
MLLLGRPMFQTDPDPTFPQTRDFHAHSLRSPLPLPTPFLFRVSLSLQLLRSLPLFTTALAAAL